MMKYEGIKRYLEIKVRLADRESNAALKEIVKVRLLKNRRRR